MKDVLNVWVHLYNNNILLKSDHIEDCGNKITAICFFDRFSFVDNFINDSLFFTFQVSEAIRIFDESVFHVIDHEMCCNYEVSVCQ